MRWPNNGILHSRITLINRKFVSIKVDSINEFCLQKTFLRSFFKAFAPVHKVYRTALVFPTDNYMVLNYGQCIDLTQPWLFYNDNMNPREASKQCETFSVKSRRLVEVFGRLDVNKTEMVALGGLILCNECKSASDK